MEACAENKIPLIVLDRDNLNSNYIDGPVLDLNYRSFVGMHQVPVLWNDNRGIRINDKWRNCYQTSKM